ncbi:MAG: RNA polymerase sigma factor [Planctomycetota bacterium]
MRNRRGDFEAEVGAVYPALVRAATVLCASGSDVDDVVQETVMRAFTSYKSFRGDSSFQTWACAILARVAATANRQRSQGIPDDYVLSRPQELPPVDTALVHDEEARLLIDAVRELPERQREMVTLHFLEELPYRDIAKALGVSVGTVKATIFTAKMSLRSALAKRDIRGEVGNVMP